MESSISTQDPEEDFYKLVERTSNFDARRADPVFRTYSILELAIRCVKEYFRNIGLSDEVVIKKLTIHELIEWYDSNKNKPRYTWDISTKGLNWGIENKVSFLYYNFPRYVKLKDELENIRVEFLEPLFEKLVQPSNEMSKTGQEIFDRFKKELRTVRISRNLVNGSEHNVVKANILVPIGIVIINEIILYKELSIKEGFDNPNRHHAPLMNVNFANLSPFPLAQLGEYFTDFDIRRVFSSWDFSLILQEIYDEMETYFQNIGLSEKVTVLRPNIHDVVILFKDYTKKHPKPIVDWDVASEGLKWMLRTPLNVALYYSQGHNKSSNILRTNLSRFVDLARFFLESIVVPVQPDDYETIEISEITEEIIETFSTIKLTSFFYEGQRRDNLEVDLMFFLMLLLINEVHVYKKYRDYNTFDLDEILDDIEENIGDVIKDAIMEALKS